MAASDTPSRDLKRAAVETAELERRHCQEALERAERRLRSFLTHGHEAMARIDLEVPISLTTDPDEQIEHYYRYAYVADCNDRAAYLLDQAGAEAMIGTRLEALSPRSDPEAVRRLYEGIRSRWRFSQVERDIGGRTFLVTREGVVEDGLLRGVWLTLRDISALKQAEGQVWRLNAELERRVKELTELKARLEQDNQYLQEEIRTELHLEEMVGSSPAFLALASRIRLVAATSATVLICGETGTGKEMVVRAIHNLSPRRERPLVKVNCAAISAGLVESELFGHVKGAFTGASERRIERFEYASGGTLSSPSGRR